jgi:hypothetical protein
MKTTKLELNVDFIGGQGNSLTTEEQKAISEFIKQRKLTSSKTEVKKTVRTKQKNATT